jgi:zinc carboxypeptidase
MSRSTKEEPPPRLFSGRLVARLLAIVTWALASTPIGWSGVVPHSPAKAQPAAGPRPDWRTPAERSDYRTTPSYEETIAYVRRIAAAAPRQVRIETFGRSGEGRDLIAVLLARDGLFDPEALHRAGRPVVLIQNSIHAGEMDGKDACLALLRDLVVTKEKAGLLKQAVLVVIPIYNVDGHERSGPYNRINQNGPQETGFRTQARNLNLNRDYMKADAPETRAFLRLWARLLPDLFVDTHVTDGADFQYDTTYALDSGPDAPAAQAEWGGRVLAPYLEASVGKAGHVIGPYVSLKNNRDPTQGLTIGATPPRFSTGYVVLQNRIGLLVETHMLKPYKTRVTGTYELLRAVLELVNRDASALVSMNRDADAATVAAGKRYDPQAAFPLRLEADGATEPFQFRGYEFKIEPSAISGTERIDYSEVSKEMTVPRQTTLRVARSVPPPRAYIVPAPWTPVVDVLQAHGLRIVRTSHEWTGEVETYRCHDATWLDHPFEGRQILFNPGEGRSTAGAGVRCDQVRQTLSFPAGSAVVPLDQRAARVAIHFLEPEAADSAVAWGFFNAIFEQKEYAESYVMEKVAREMLDKDPDLRAEFDRRLSTDSEFAASPEARLDFFYRRSPFWDPRLGLYPVGRLLTLEGVPLAREEGRP